MVTLAQRVKKSPSSSFFFHLIIIVLLFPGLFTLETEDVAIFLLPEPRKILAAKTGDRNSFDPRKQSTMFIWECKYEITREWSHPIISSEAN